MEISVGHPPPVKRKPGKTPDVEARLSSAANARLVSVLLCKSS
jgi:hypothetical protein